MGQYNEGIENLDKSIALDPNYTDAYHYKAAALKALVKENLAEACLKNVRIPNKKQVKN